MGREDVSAWVKGKQFLLKDEEESMHTAENEGYTAIKRSTLERCYPPAETAQNLTPRPGAEGYVRLCSFPVFRCAWNTAMIFTHLHLNIYIQMNWYTNTTSRN